MRHHLHLFFVALTFLTRIRAPLLQPYQGNDLQHAAQYFPWVGMCIGGLFSLSVLLFIEVLPLHISVILAMLMCIFLTGALHEDGLADMADGFGGSYTKDNALSIMKDSRVGTYGVLALVFILFLKFNTITFLVSHYSTCEWILIFIGSHSISRLMPIFIMYTLPYASILEQSKSPELVTNILSLKHLFVACIPVCFLIYAMPVLGFLVCMSVAFTVLFAYYLLSRIQGYTGDTLGALQQMIEVMLYIVLVSIA